MMWRRSLVPAFLSFALASSLVVALADPAAALFIEVDHFATTHASLQLLIAGPSAAMPTCTGPSTVTISDLNGPATVDVFFDGPGGMAHDSNGNMLDDVPTKMVDLNLTGTSPFGPVSVNIRPPTKSPMMSSSGQIEETANTMPGRLDIPPFAPTGTATSFFDIFFELHVAGMTLHNQAPAHLTSTITQLPPTTGTIYNGVGNVPLFDEANQPTCYSFTHPNHTTGAATTSSCNLSPSGATIQAGGGIQSITHTETNATVTVAPFTPGATSATVTFHKTDPTMPATVALNVIDMSGTVEVCDPSFVSLSAPHATRQRLTGIAQADSQVTVTNGEPGFRAVTILVNRSSFRVRSLAPGETKVVDVSSAMQPGNSNVINLTSSGGRNGATADVLVGG